FLVGEVLVTRTIGKATLFAHRLSRDDAYRPVQVLHHPPDDNLLLEVLLSEHRHVRRHETEQPADDRGHTVEVPRPERAAEIFAVFWHRNDRGTLDTERIHRLHFGDEQDVRARA